MNNRNPSPEMDYLSERIKKAQQKRQQPKTQLVMPLRLQKQDWQQSEQQRSQVSTNVTRQQEWQVMPVILQQVSDSPVQQQRMIPNTGQNNEQTALIPREQVHLQRQPMSPQRELQQMTVTSPVQQWQQSPLIEHPERSWESGQQTPGRFGHQTNNEFSITESSAYIQKVINRPKTTIVQRQVKGDTAKILIVFPNQESKRLITFDIPNEDCTVQDLLNEANISFRGETTVSLISDPALGVNYMVEAGQGTCLCRRDKSETCAAHSRRGEKMSPGGPSSPTREAELSPDSPNSPSQEEKMSPGSPTNPTQEERLSPDSPPHTKEYVGVLAGNLYLEGTIL